MICELLYFNCIDLPYVGSGILYIIYLAMYMVYGIL